MKLGLDRFSLKARLIACLAALGASLFMAGGFGLWAMTTISGNTATIVDDRLARAEALQEVSNAYALQIIDSAQQARGSIVTNDAAIAAITAARARISERWTHFSSFENSPEAQGLIDSARTVMSAADPQLDLLITVLRSGDAAALRNFVNESLYPAIDPVTEALADLIVRQNTAVHVEYEAAMAASDNAITLIMLIAGISLVVLLVAITFVIRGVATPLTRITASMQEMADGNLEVAVPFASNRDELGRMASALDVFRQNGLRVREMTEEEKERIERNRIERAEMMQELQRAFGNVVDAASAGDFSKQVEAQFPDAELNALAQSVNSLVTTVDRGLKETGTVLAALADTDLTKRVSGTYQGAFETLKDDTNAVADKLTEVVSQLRTTSGVLKTATGEILSGSNDLADRTTRQAATIEETSAATQQLSSTVTDNANRAEEARKNASAVARTAEDGGQVMAEANTAMERITQSSARISNIIGMIDDIAFQTNLLALNASVEAARAGEAGKGFAVVAVEVRRLAQSAAQASSEVKVLIEQSEGEVASGSKLVASAAERLGSIVASVRDMAGLMNQIADDSKEQASSIDELNLAVRQMDEMTQHNAALVEETNAAIEQTESQANELDRIIEVFKITGGGNAPSMVKASQKPAAQGASPVKKLQQKAAAYLSHGNAAIDRDWSEF
jgi:methyl-accepting chemotaxis protein